MTKRIRRLARSFRYAFRGVFYAVRTGRNMRIHLVAAVCALLLSRWYECSAAESVQLVIVIAMVMAAELINTALEVVVNQQSPAYNDFARIAKDVAAGAVLVCSLAAACCGFFLFWDPQRLMALVQLIARRPFYQLLLLLGVAAAICFILMEPEDWKRWAYMIKHRRK